MKTIHIHDSVVCHDDYKLEEKPELQELLQDHNLKDILSSIPQAITLVLGGDGIMLEAIQENYLSERPFLGINFGTLGFLLNDKKWVNPSSNFIERQYPLLQVKQNGEIIGVGCNDINLYSPTGKMVKLDISLGEKGTLELSGDGAIIATPAGSTGHSKSYFGPVIPHVNKALVITPKGNTTPESSKMIADNETIIVDYVGRKFGLGINLDGTPMYTSKYDEEVSLEIQKLAREITFLISEDHEQDWDAKVMQQQGFRL